MRIALPLLLCVGIPGAGGCSSGDKLPGREQSRSQSESKVGGTLDAAAIRQLIAQMTLAEKVAMIHGAPEGTNCNSNPAAGPIFPVISPSFAGCAGQAGYNNGVPRLGIPPLRQTDGPAGIRLGHEATALPAPVGLAATFDRSSARDFGAVMGREGRAINQDVLYAPMINAVTVPTAGRNFETLGEDAFLMGEIVAEQVKGVQSEGLIATLKHFAMNDFENARMQTSIAIDEQTLQELELPAFEKGVRAGAGAVMCAYSRVNDVYSCSSDHLLNQVLRGQFGFTGWVLSDFGATHRLSDLMYGLDSAMPQGNNAGLRDDPDPGTLRDPPGVGDPGTGRTLTTAAIGGSPAIATFNDWPAVPAITSEQWQAALDEAVFHILTSMNDVGLLEGTSSGSRFTDGTPAVPPRPDLASLLPASFQIAEDIAEKSATLLRNERKALPLRRADFQGPGIVVMGPTSVTPYVGGGGSAHVIPFDDVPNAFDALVTGAGRNGEVRFVPGYDLDGEIVSAAAVGAPPDSAFAGQAGWLRTQISTVVPASGAAPAPCSADCAADRLDGIVDYTAATLPAATAWRWRATFTAPSDGTWQLKIFAMNQSSAQLFVDGLAINPNRRINLGAYAAGGGGFGTSNRPSWHALLQTAKSHDPLSPKFQQAGFTVTLTAGETHTLDLRAYAGASAPLQLRLVWVPPDWQARSIAAAVEAARHAKKVVVFAYDEGTEGTDRGVNNQATGLRLPGYQDDLITAVAAVNRHTIVVLNTGDPVLMPWAADVDAILQMWYPGQRGGTATARILLGDANPGGKLPVTFPADPAQMPTVTAECNPGVITNNPPNDGNCPLYPGVFQPGFVTGNHSYKTIDFTTNGIFQGYRWYDRFGVAPLFPFGHGLSYTQFGYSNLQIIESPGSVEVRFTVRNIGGQSGAEVAQLYLGPPSKPPEGVDMPLQKLVGFARVELKPGQATTVSMPIDQRELSYWSVLQHDWVVAEGRRAILVGASSRDIRLRGQAAVVH